jgi:hypothetical protein
VPQEALAAYTPSEILQLYATLQEGVMLAPDLQEPPRHSKSELKQSVT